MTTHSDNRPPAASTECIAGVGDLLVAIPALLGFAPHRSLILICIRSTGSGTPSIGTIMRHDLILPPGSGDIDGTIRIFSPAIGVEMTEVIDRFAAVCAQNGEDAALGVIVDDRWVPPVQGNGGDRRFRALATQLTENLRAVGTRLPQVFVTQAIVDGGLWRSLTGLPQQGALSDPSISSVALAYAVDGRTVHESRSALEQAMEPIDDELAGDVERCIAVATEMDSGSDRVRVEAVVAQLQWWSSRSRERPAVVELLPARAAQFGVALRSVMVRDSLLAIALTDMADIAEQLWMFLMRTLPASERACPATLLGFFAYARGDGALASVAIDIALDADANYSLAKLLERSLQAGAPPEMIREVALSGYQVAELCGVRLPPRID
ncbi:DUF4192 domain-containing protein [Rhodococcus sp. G-MC3]|uniref:DUF4192 domain-containing protein n=1 Tax=Rhodococcus sp. G-MC3 TaxID=3046209 RepID=UPI0024B94BE7|nr:DUF4192 domain-containing protein [Rhodococcus sp. G-MC3]MDJ0391746.1 DUF4192 domain-containing protein [Rhodococcus sp. G-MC3]